MAILTATTVKPLNDQTLEVTGLALNGAPVVGATVTATLVDEHGVPVTGIIDVSMTDVSGSPGSYSAAISHTFTAPAGDYTLQITAVDGGAQYYTEQAVTIPYLLENSNLIPGALCSLAALKAWAILPTTTNNINLDATYAKVINRFTEYAAQRCNRPSFLAASYTERMNGNAKYFVTPRFAFPTNEIQSVSSVTINGAAQIASTDEITSGYLFDDFAIYLRNGVFCKGVQNVSITYTAGLAAIPLELEEAAVESCAYWLKRREYIGQASVSVSGQTITFNKEDIPCVAASVLAQYTRRR